MLLRLILSILGMAAGFGLIIKTSQVVNFTGENMWVEETFGNGQTYNFYKILGMIISFASFLYLIGDLDGIIRAIINIIVP